MSEPAGRVTSKGYFGDVKVTRETHSDYLFRARVPRSEVIAAITKQIESINYPNFKDSVLDHRLHQAYMSVWTAMSRTQNPPPYSGYKEEEVRSSRRKATKASE